MLKFSKYICIFSLLIALFVFKPGVALAAGGFTGSCSEILADARLDTINDQATKAPYYLLMANCKTEKGGSKNTYVDLNEHIINRFGKLAWLKNGAFVRSTRNCRLYPNNFIRGITVLRCEAADGRGNWVPSLINLDEQIANYNGNLTVLSGF